MADHPLVARKQARHAARRGRVDREQITRHIDHALQPSVARHVDPVVVARAEVDRGKAAALELRRSFLVAPQQCGAGVAVAFGLEDVVTINRPELADGAIHRADKVGRCQRAGIGAQGAGEKSVEAGVGAEGPPCLSGV